MSENKAADQLKNFAEREKNSHEQLTTGHGCPVGQRLASMTAGPRGPILLKDVNYIDEIAHFDRERIPERVVHAKGAGAFGYFEVTHDISAYTKAVVFNKVGKRTPVAVRFSTVGGESGSADTARDPRGFAIKFYTEHGIWDLVGNNTPIFFIRDPILFPSFIHTQKRNPVTHLKDPNMFWDFITLRPETCHQVSFLFSDRGTPDGFRHMNGYGSHTFKLINEKGVANYCKFHFKTNQGIKNLTAEKAAELRGSNPDYAIEDLFNAISAGNPPSWSLHIQLMSEEEADRCPFNPFDVTKVWPQVDYPLRPVGQLVLKQNPRNYFASVEQIAFSPAHLIPGIDVSPDKMLQGRLLSYHDTQNHRLGPNSMQIPVNCPYRSKTFQRDGLMCTMGNFQDAPNYYPNSFCPIKQNEMLEPVFETVHGVVKRYDSSNEDNFSQVGVFWREVLTEDQRARLIENMSKHLSGAADFIQERAVQNFSQCDEDYGRRLRKALDQLKKESDS